MGTRRKSRFRSPWAFVAWSVGLHALLGLLWGVLGPARDPGLQLQAGAGAQGKAAEDSWDLECLVSQALASGLRGFACLGAAEPGPCWTDLAQRVRLERLGCRRVVAPTELALIEAEPLNPAVPPAPEPDRATQLEEAQKPEREPDKLGRTVDIAQPQVEVRPDQAKFLSEYDSKVEREQRSKLPSSLEPTPPARPATPASPARPPEPPAAATAPAKPALAMRQGAATAGLRPGDKGGEVESDAAGTLERRGEGGTPGPKGQDAPADQGTAGGAGRPQLFASNEELARKAGSGSVDDLSDVEEGDQNFLNTKRWKYATFFNRVKRAVYKSWAPSVDSAYRLRDPSGKIYGQKNRLTVVQVSLRPNGQVEDIIVVEPSGVGFLDEVAVQAFKQAQPFPNPPGGLVDKDSQKIVFRFGFRLEIGDTPTFQMFRYE